MYNSNLTQVKPRADRSSGILRSVGRSVRRVSADGSLEVRRRPDAEGEYQCEMLALPGRLLSYPVHLRFPSIFEQRIAQIVTGPGGSGSLGTFRPVRCDPYLYPDTPPGTGRSMHILVNTHG
ncbi:hypothetical protein EVAR_57800_1 [Eumeta japonica]|uniref:Uncharacterized protein n=1 Tax=Eumeta variegata TaxID=151549 RepID=A0A4C1Y868_EUMVA|nr:hypothetical protein EVAR_57800_1 [Eumeta japonica]